MDAPVTSKVIDNSSADYSESGTWSAMDWQAYGYQDKSVRQTNVLNSSAKWMAQLQQQGTYDVYVWNPSFYVTPDSSVQVSVFHKGTTVNSTISQASGQNWIKIGTYDFSGDNSEYVKMTKTANDSNYMRTDSVMFVLLNLLVNETDSGFTTSPGSSWGTSTTTKGWDGSSVKWINTLNASGRWTPTIPVKGWYDVSVWLPVYSNNIKNATYKVHHNGKDYSINMDLTTGSSRWVDLGAFDFASGNADYVEICQGTSLGVIRADAIKLMPVDSIDSTPPAAPSGLTYINSADSTLGNFKMDVSWSQNTETDIKGYNIYLNGYKFNWTLLKAPKCNFQTLAASTSYDTKVTAVDTSGNESAKTTLNTSTISDTTPPVLPNATLTATRTGSGSIVLNVVTPSGQNANSEYDFIGYNLYIDGVFNQNFYSRVELTGLTNGKMYNFSIKPVDRSGNEQQSSLSASEMPVDEIISAYGTLNYRDNIKTGSWGESSLPRDIGGMIYTWETGPATYFR